MIPVALLILISAELALYAGVAHRAVDVPWGAAAAAAVACLLGVRAVIVGVTWGFALAYRSPAPRLSG